MRKVAASCWNIVLLLWAFLDISVKEMCFCYDIQVPKNYTALNGDLEVTIIGIRRKSSEEIRLELLEWELVRKEDLEDEERTAAEEEEENEEEDEEVGKKDKTGEETEGETKKETLTEVRIYDGHESEIPQIKVRKRWKVLGSVIVPSSGYGNNSDVVKVIFPCGVITKGGQYGVRLTGINPQLNNLTRKFKNLSKMSSITRENNSGDISIVGLDVRWPPCILSISPRHIETYPEATVTALVQFLPTACSPAPGAPMPETWLDLLSCGHSPLGCTHYNSTHKQIVYSEQIRGYPRRRSIILRCELFGMAGHFALSLRSSVEIGTWIETENKDSFLKAVWSEQYIFNVHARSIFPCDTHAGGVPVLFQYPKCILKGDRVRLFSRLRADVSSLAPPTTLHYVTEQRVLKGKHSLYFDCDLFTEQFVEYCFVYVSQAITGAVTDVRMDCVPTLPVTGSGGWGPWSPWSPCTTTCGGGTRNRFRYCDSPEPKYGARYCEGPSVESERCGNSDWNCEFYQKYPIDNNIELPADKPEIMAEVGPGCRCGCVIILNSAKPRRLLATSTQSCPGRTFWVIQTEEGHVIKFFIDHFRFPCTSQWLKVRDGDSRSSILIAEFSTSQMSPVPITSSGASLLIEFFSDQLLAGGEECSGFFLAHAEQTQPTFSNATLITSGFSISKIIRNLEIAPTANYNLTLVHGVVALFLSVVIFASGCLGIQYVHRYRKYHLAAAAAEDMESVTGDSENSLGPVRSRATSNSTLLSEVISLQRFRPTRRYKHTRLREEDREMEEEHLCDSDSPNEKDNSESPTLSQKTLKPDTDIDCSTTASLPDTPKVSPSAIRRSLTCLSGESSGKTDSYKISKKSISNGLNPLPDDICNSSSLDSSTSRESSEVVRKIFQLRRPSISSSSTKSGSAIQSTIHNGYDSPSSSLRSVSSKNPKERKEKRNLERLLAGSEFSLSGDADLELDYYDYNVHNASAVPESYIGMDPAYLIWIPPISPVSWDGDKDEKEKSETENLIKDSNIDEEIKLSSSTPRKVNIIIENENQQQNDAAIVERANNRGPNNRVSKDHNRKTAKRADQYPERGRYLSLSEEKETRVEKSPSDLSIYYDVGDDDIKYADDDDDEIKADNSKYDIITDTNKGDGYVKT